MPLPAVFVAIPVVVPTNTCNPAYSVQTPVKISSADFCTCWMKSQGPRHVCKIGGSWLRPPASVRMNSGWGLNARLPFRGPHQAHGPAWHFDWSVHWRRNGHRGPKAPATRAGKLSTEQDAPGI